MMFRSTASSQQMVPPGSGRSDPNRIAPYLTHLETHHGQLTLVPPQNAGRTRKSGKKNPERPRPDRRRESDEPRFNTAAPTTPRGASRRGNNSAGRAARVPMPPPNAVRDSMIPDYPPPSFQEALMSPPFIPPPLSETSADVVQPDAPEVDPTPDTSSPPPVDRPESLSLPAAPSQPPSLTVQTAVAPSGSLSSPPSSQPNSDQSGSSGSGSDEASSRTSSLEIVGYDVCSDGWDADRRRGVSLKERVEHEQRRLLFAESTTNLALDHFPQSGHADGPNHCTHCGSPKPGSVHGRQIPLPDPVDFMEQVPDGLTPPSSPKSKKSWKKILHPIVPHDTKSSHDSISPLSPEPRSPTTGTFGFLQGAWASTLTLASTNGGSPSKSNDNPSPSSVKRRESSGIRRLFTSKGKERDTSPAGGSAPVDDEPWEFVNRASIIWSEEQDRKGISRPISPISEVPQEADRHLSGTSSPRSTRKYSLASPHTPFLNRPIRQATTNGSTLTLSMNHSVLSLQASTVAGPSASRAGNTFESGNHDYHEQKKAKRTPPPPPPPRRKAVSTTMNTSPAATWLPTIDTAVATAGGARTYAEVASPTQTLASPVTATAAASLHMHMPRPYPSLPSLRPSSREGVEASLPSPPPSAGIYGTFNTAPPAFLQDSDAVSIASSPAAMTSVSMSQPRARIPPPVMTVTDSFSTMSLDSPNITPPRTPTTPTHPHHYPGRPLPQPPRPQPPRQQPPRQVQPALPCRQPSPLRTTAAVAAPASPAVSPILERSHFTDLDALASRVIEGHPNCRNYEVSPDARSNFRRLSTTSDPQDLMRISEATTPAPVAVVPDPFLIDGETLKIPPSGRVRLERRRVMKDGRVKLRLTLLGEPVDKCGVCLTHFKDAEVACLGTHCQHAFHEYCLKRWLVRSRSCPLCKLTI